MNHHFTPLNALLFAGWSITIGLLFAQCNNASTAEHPATTIERARDQGHEEAQDKRIRDLELGSTTVEKRETPKVLVIGCAQPTVEEIEDEFPQLPLEQLRKMK